MIHGIININKEKGFTSHDVVAKLRGIVGQKKIGHTGTLDPDATGVLPVCFGKATKLCDMLTDKDKTYETVLLLGKTTDTQDVTGEILEEKSTDCLKESVVESCIMNFVGDYNQVPPMYSALKVNGKKLYELAREGKVIERKARPVVIHSIRIKNMNLPRVTMEVTCSKGTYIRTLCHDIGDKLSCGGCMESLIRTRVSRFCLEDSLTLAEVETYKQDRRLEDIIIPIDEMFESYQKVTMLETHQMLAYNGNMFAASDIAENEVYKEQEAVRVYDVQGHFIGIWQYKKETDTFQIVKMFYDGDV